MVHQTAAALATTDDFENVACCLCGTLPEARDSVTWARHHLNLVAPYGVVRCPSCSLAFLSPRPGAQSRAMLLRGLAPDSLKAFSERTANYAAVTRGRRKWFEDRLDELSSLVESCRGRTFLEIGASSGTMVELARQRGFSATGIEPSRAGAQASYEAGIVFPRAVAEQLPFKAEIFDVIHSNHVFEHLVDPLAAARECYRVARPGAVCFVEVPNQLDNISMRRDVALGRVSQRKRDMRSVHHLWFFNQSSLRRLFLDAGFQSVRVTSHFPSLGLGVRGALRLAMRAAGAVAFGGPILRAVATKQA